MDKKLIAKSTKDLLFVFRVKSIKNLKELSSINTTGPINPISVTKG